MNYKTLFNELRRKGQAALMPFVVIGDPDYETSLEVVKTIIKSGADILELGLPFSDPTADGPTIQLADQRALQAGLNTDRCFQFLQEIRSFSEIPVGLLVYGNLVYQRGIEQFYQDAAAAGVNSVLVADLPIEEAEPFIAAARTHDIAPVFIISPLTTGERQQRILQQCQGFVYLVSRLGVTGARKELYHKTEQLIRRIKPATALPLAVGFGISTPEQVRKITRAGADAAIVGSAIVKLIGRYQKDTEELLKSLAAFVPQLKQATILP